MARCVVVTGGFGTLGRAIGARFRDVGNKVVRIDAARSAPDAEATLDIAGIDITDEHQAMLAIDRVTSEIGAPAVLVNVAGGFVWETMADGAMTSWERMYQLNVTTALLMTRAVLPFMRHGGKGGRIINIGALAALRATTGMGAYAASKAALHRLTESTAEEVAGKGITVNAILPSIIDTPANRADMPDADTSTWVAPAAIADIAWFLASEDARAINGALIPASNGTPT
jgi:NAD(P)-dependent dehydrogenase (short-subunit alcohol dehydrogenase family)